MIKEWRREAVFNGLKEITHRELQQGYIAERLGETGEAISAALESSFVLPRYHGTAFTPEEQEYTDNIGIHPVLSMELRHPVLTGDVTLRSHDRQYLQKVLGDSDFEDILDETTVERPHTPKEVINSLSQCAAFITYGSQFRAAEGDRHSFYYRPVIFVNMARMAIAANLSGRIPLWKAMIMAHELDHAVKLSDMKHNELAAVASEYQGHKWLEDARTSVLLERSASQVSAAMLVPERYWTSDHSHLTKRMKDMDPRRAGRYIKRLRPYHERFMGASALTELFAGDLPVPTDNEVIAYRAAGFI